MALKSYGWYVRNIAKTSPKKAKNSHFSIFFSIFSKTVHTIRTKLSTVILHNIRVLYVQLRDVKSFSSYLIKYQVSLIQVQVQVLKF